MEPDPTVPLTVLHPQEFTVVPQEPAHCSCGLNGRRRVVIAHPLASATGKAEIQLRRGDKGVVAFAVGEGGKRKVSALKSWSNKVLHLE